MLGKYSVGYIFGLEEPSFQPKRLGVIYRNILQFVLPLIEIACSNNVSNKEEAFSVVEQNFLLVRVICAIVCWNILLGAPCWICTDGGKCFFI